ncbi:cell division protein FtsA [bacterium]|nr:cell division protein FtsA [bacterium]
MDGRSVIASLDVGSSKVAFLIGKTSPDSAQIDVVGIGYAPVNSVRKGVVIDIEKTVSAISEALEQAERMSGIKVSEVVLGIGGAHIESQSSKGVIAVARPDGEVTPEDRDRVIEAAQAIAQPTNREILHVIPQNFILDGQGGIKDPVGMTGIRLEVETHIITGSTPAINNLEKCVFQAGLTAPISAFDALAEAEVFLDAKQREIGVILIDLGAATTQLVVYEEGTIIHSAVLPVGGNLITNDIAIGLKTSLEVAEQVKLKYGSATPENISETQTIDLSKIDPDEKEEVSRKYVAEIIEARLAEILEMVRSELRKIKRDAKLPAGAVFVGGSSQIKGLVELSKKVLKLPSNLGTPQAMIGGLTDKVQDPSFAAALSLLFWGKHHAPQRGEGLKLLSTLGERLKNLWRIFRP